jgi:hypothetical protein
MNGLGLIEEQKAPKDEKESSRQRREYATSPGLALK